jgi:tetrahydrodipicolinate N-succinyltransferase
MFLSFSDAALVKARLASLLGVYIRHESFANAGVTITADLPEANARRIVWMITDLTSGRASIWIKR